MSHKYAPKHARPSKTQVPPAIAKGMYAGLRETQIGKQIRPSSHGTNHDHHVSHGLPHAVSAPGKSPANATRERATNE